MCLFFESTIQHVKLMTAEENPNRLCKKDSFCFAFGMGVGGCILLSFIIVFCYFTLIGLGLGISMLFHWERWCSYDIDKPDLFYGVCFVTGSVSAFVIFLMFVVFVCLVSWLVHCCDSMKTDIENASAGATQIQQAKHVIETDHNVNDTVVELED